MKQYEKLLCDHERRYIRKCLGRGRHKGHRMLNSYRVTPNLISITTMKKESGWLSSPTKEMTDSKVPGRKRYEWRWNW